MAILEVENSSVSTTCTTSNWAQKVAATPAPSIPSQGKTKKMEGAEGTPPAPSFLVTPTTAEGREGSPSV